VLLNVLPSSSVDWVASLESSRSNFNHFQVSLPFLLKAHGYGSAFLYFYVPEAFIMYFTQYGAVYFLIVPYKGLYGWGGGST
jgi:hypothetical protein